METPVKHPRKRSSLPLGCLSVAFAFFMGCAVTYFTTHVSANNIDARRAQLVQEQSRTAYWQSRLYTFEVELWQRHVAPPVCTQGTSETCHKLLVKHTQEIGKQRQAILAEYKEKLSACTGDRKGDIYGACSRTARNEMMQAWNETILR